MEIMYQNFKPCLLSGKSDSNSLLLHSSVVSLYTMILSSLTSCDIGDCLKALDLTRKGSCSLRDVLIQGYTDKHATTNMSMIRRLDSYLLQFGIDDFCYKLGSGRGKWRRGPVKRWEGTKYNSLCRFQGCKGGYINYDSAIETPQIPLKCGSFAPLTLRNLGVFKD